MRIFAHIPLLVGVVSCAPAPPPQARSLPAADSSRIDLDTLRGAIYTVSHLDGPITALISPPPDYPSAVKAAGVQGRVLLQVVVDTLGFPEPATIRVLESPDPELSLSATNALRRCRYTPGRVGGRAVRTLIRIPYDFRIRGF